MNLNNLKVKFTNYKLPRWNELPEIHFYMDQVIEFTEKYLKLFLCEDSGKLISPSIVNNYVKHKIIPSPEKKRYSREHIALLLIICILKPIMPISSIKFLIDCQLKNISLEQFYNNFCYEQETSLKNTIHFINENINTPDKDRAKENFSNTIMKSAIASNSNKVIVDKLLHMNS